MPRWIAIARCEECPPGASLETVAEERIIALYNVDGAYFALDGICPHLGGPLGKGVLTRCVVTCPWHGWQFDVRTGQHTFAPTVQQPTLATRVNGEMVEVQLDD